MRDAPEGFLPLKVTPAEGDRLILSPAYVFPANIMERGLFAGVRLSSKTIIGDASNGRTAIADACVTLCADIDLPCVPKELPVKISAHGAQSIAEMMATPEEARGWRRSFNSAKVLFRTDEFRFAWHAYIIRGPLLIDAFTGGSSEAADLIDILLG